jgi:hypothetical protein
MSCLAGHTPTLMIESRPARPGSPEATRNDPPPRPRPDAIALSAPASMLEAVRHAALVHMHQSLDDKSTQRNKGE